MNDDNNLWQQMLRGKPNIYIKPSDINFKDAIASLFDYKEKEIKDNTKKQYVINVYNKYCKKLKLKKNDKSIIMFIKDVLYYYNTNINFVKLNNSFDFNFSFTRESMGHFSDVDYIHLYNILNLDSMKQFFKDLEDE